MKFPKTLVYLIILVCAKYEICVATSEEEGELKLPSMAKEVKGQIRDEIRDVVSKNWPFFSSDTNTVPNRKPAPGFGKPLKPKPISGAQPVWSYNNDDKGWSSIGWVNMQSVCASTIAATSYELTKTTLTATEIETKTQTITTTETEYEYETETLPQGPVSGWVAPIITGWVAPITTGWVAPTTTTFTITDTTTSVQTETSTVEMTIMHHQTNFVSSTQTTTTTSTIYNIVTATTFITSTASNTPTFTTAAIQCRDGKCSTSTSSSWSYKEATIVLQPSFVFEQTTSTITSTVSETPTLTVIVPTQKTVTTGLQISAETVTSYFSTTPPITVTEIIATSLDQTIDTVVSTLLTNSPSCTTTQYEYLRTVTTPTLTITASFCGNPCGTLEKCAQVCFPKTATTTITVTSTSIATLQPILVTYAATETKTSYSIEESLLLTTSTLDVTRSPMKVTETETEVLPAQVSTDTTQVTLTSFPVTIVTPENLCTFTVFETCTRTTTLPPVNLTLTDTEIVGVVGTIFSQTTSFIAPPIPTVTSYIQGNVNAITATVTTTIITDSKAFTTTITKNETQVGFGSTTITPTKTVFSTRTAVITSTPVINATAIKKRTLMVEEYTTDLVETTEIHEITPTITDYIIVEITPPPIMVTVSSLFVGWST